ncbi:MAG: YvcK family protein [Fimbriimonadaceae bacterium]|nr:YvcK family protein [Fimbriimonadaceae bacterium]
MISRKLRSVIKPTARLARLGTVATFGVLLALFGLIVTFRAVLGPMVGGVARGWGRFLRNLSTDLDIELATHVVGGVCLVAGGFLAYRGVRSLIRQLGSGGDEDKNGSFGVNAYLRRQMLANGPKIVALGGGTGLSTLLRGLKQYSSNITAVVTVSDDGGSSGRLVQELGIMPPGDIRNCLVALADAEKRMTDLFQHRFTKGSGALAGHSLGNLLLAGFIEQAGGDVDNALVLATEVLAIRGRVVPSTTAHVTLKALMEDGGEIEGETAIVESTQRIRRIYLEPENPPGHAEAVRAIAEADLIVMGPGSVYTSIVPNLLVAGIPEAICASKAKKAYVCNVMTQRGESDHFTAAEHVVAIQANVPKRVFDYVLVNTGTPSEGALDKYRGSGQEFVVPDVERVKQMGYRPVHGNLMSETDYVRHDPVRVAAILMGLLDR